MMNKKNDFSVWRIVGIAWNLGWLIALPLVGFAIAGRFFDKWLKTSPLFFLIGVILAIICSSILVFRKTTELLREAEGNEKNNRENKTD